jgi:hypothetical protein
MKSELIKLLELAVIRSLNQTVCESDLEVSELVQQVLTEYTSAKQNSSTSNCHLLFAVVKSSQELQDSAEFDALVAQIKEGFTTGLDSCDTGTYYFDVITNR